MNITTTTLHAGALKIFVAGKLNALTAVDFHREIELIPQGTKIIFDFRELNYISSAGLSEILVCRKKFPTMRIENMRREVYMLFLMTGFDEFIPIALTENISVRVDVSFKKFLRDKAIYSEEEIFVIGAGEEHTWQNIEHGSKVIANELHKAGVQQNDSVAICGANSINWLQAFFAVQRIGALAVLVDCNLSAEKIGALVNAAGVTHFLYGEMPAATDEKIFLYELQKFSGGKIQSFHSFRDDLDFKARLAGKSKFHVIVRAEDPAVMIFNADGSNEILSAEKILQAAQSHLQEKNLSANEKFSVNESFGSFQGLVEIFAGAIAGAKLSFEKNS